MCGEEGLIVGVWFIGDGCDLLAGACGIWLAKVTLPFLVLLMEVASNGSDTRAQTFRNRGAQISCLASPIWGPDWGIYITVLPYAL